MAYTLNGSAIRRPTTMSETNSTQVAQNRTLSGSIARDYFGSNKRVWQLQYNNTNSTDYTTIKNIYNSYLTSATAMTWAISETNYTVNSTNVHVDVLERGFSIKGTDYLSDFTLILTEA